MSDAPERIAPCAHEVDEMGVWAEGWEDTDECAGVYIREDLHAAEIDRLTARVAELEGALLPFSNEAGWWFEKNYSASDSPVEGFSDYQGVMTCGDLFAARVALTSQEAAQ